MFRGFAETTGFAVKPIAPPALPDDSDAVAQPLLGGFQPAMPLGQAQPQPFQPMPPAMPLAPAQPVPQAAMPFQAPQAYQPAGAPSGAGGAVRGS